MLYYISVPNGTLFKRRDKMFAIENWFLLNNLSKEAKTEIINSFSQSKHYKKGETIYSDKAFSKAIGVVLNGSAAAHGENVLKKNFYEGDTFGAAALFGNESPYISRITAKTDCEILFVDEKELRFLFEQHPEASINYISFLSERVRLLNRKISLFTCKGATMKLYKYLTDNADENNTVKIVNMTSLARLTSIGRTSLYRAMEELTESGVIERNGSTIKIK